MATRWWMTASHRYKPPRRKRIRWDLLGLQGPVTDRSIDEVRRQIISASHHGRSPEPGDHGPQSENGQITAISRYQSGLHCNTQRANSKTRTERSPVEREVFTLGHAANGQCCDLQGACQARSSARHNFRGAFGRVIYSKR